MKLFKPFWMSKDPDIRKEAVVDIKDNKLLEKIVFESLHDDVKHLAIQNISDIHLLKKIVLKHSNNEVRSNAMACIFNDGILLEIIDESTDEKVIKEVEIHRLNYGFCKDGEKDEVDLDAADEDGRTPLIRAAKKGDIGRVEELIESGADINLGDDSGNTPLEVAAEYGQIDVLRRLIEEGAIIDKPNICGTTPLMGAIMAGRADSATALLNWGASVNAKNNDNESVLFLAEEGLRNAIAEQEVTGPGYERDFDRVEDYRAIIKIVKKLL